MPSFISIVKVQELAACEPLARSVEHGECIVDNFCQQTVLCHQRARIFGLPSGPSDGSKCLVRLPHLLFDLGIDSGAIDVDSGSRQLRNAANAGREGTLKKSALNSPFTLIGYRIILFQCPAAPPGQLTGLRFCVREVFAVGAKI